VLQVLALHEVDVHARDGVVLQHVRLRRQQLVADEAA
jgi:hypothetical protein